MYWLRRIPGEARVVVLVVFLALFQAILLSVFGLGAIRGEQRHVEDQLAAKAEDLLHQYVADRCETDLRQAADDVLRAAFESGDARWRQRDFRDAGGLFPDAFHVRADGGVFTPGGLPLWLPRDDAKRQEPEADAEFGTRALALAREFPFAGDFGRPTALLYAWTPVMKGDHDPETLLRARWIGILNQVAGYLDQAEVERFLKRIDEKMGDDPRLATGIEHQGRKRERLSALLRERPRFRTKGAPVLHHADRAHLFYVRPVGAGRLHVLSVDPVRFRELLEQIQHDASEKAIPGVEPFILQPGEDPPSGAPAVKIAALPGYVATATISPGVVRQQARDRGRFYWYIIAFSVAGILAGGFLTARVVAREVKLAKLKSGFVSNVSHGLKTPLTSIRMFAEMLRNDEVDDEAERRECLNVIAQETERLGKLIQQVLDFGRLDARRHPFKWTTASIQPVVEAEAARFRRATGLDERSFTLHVAVNLPAVNHDPDALSEVIANLLSNAYKYTPVKHRRIALTVGPQHRHLVLAVEDNGPGIPPRERRKIFGQFYRSGDLLTRDVEGTGLGLSIAHNIVRAHGGRIQVEESALGGSRFAVVLPALPRKRTAPAETRA